MALFSRVKVWVSNEILTAADQNAEFDNLLTNARATSITGYSADSTEMQTVEDPYPGASISLAGSVKEELTRVRYLLKQLSGQAQWYIDPVSTLGTGGILTAAIADLAVTAAKLAADAVTTAKILDANVTAAKLASDSVTTAKIADGAVTSAKLAASVSSISAEQNATGITSTSFIAANAGISIATGGRPILVFITGPTSGLATVTGPGEYAIYRDSTLLTRSGVTMVYVDTPANNTYVYALYVRSTDGSPVDTTGYRIQAIRL